MTTLTVVTALRTEYLALRGRVGDHGAGAARTELLRCGMGPTRARRWLDNRAPHPPQMVMVAGLAGALDRTLRPGDVVAATEVRDELGTIVLADVAAQVAELRRSALRVHAGAIVSTDHLVRSRDERERLAASGTAVDMESAAVVRWFVQRCPELPVAVVRVIVDTPDSPLGRLATVPAGITALRVLRQLGPTLPRWAHAFQSGSTIKTTAGDRSAVPKGVA